MKDMRLPRGWSLVSLGDIITLEYGKSFPERNRMPGPYAIYGSNGLIGRVHKYFVEEETIIVGRKGSAGEITYAEPKSWPIDTTYYVRIKDGRVFSLDFIYYLLKWLDPRRFIDTTTKPGLNRDRVYEQVVPLPPLRVQERIVQILQKADEICRKRKEALKLGGNILPALFIETFGNPTTNPKGWPIGPLNDLLDPAIERVNPTKTLSDKEFPYIEITGVRGFQIAEVKRILGRKASPRARQVVRAGDVLYSMTRPKLRNVAVVPEELDGAICTTGFAVLRPRNREDSAFIFELVRGSCFTEPMTWLAEARSLYPAVDEEQVRQSPVIQPPAPVRAHFGAIVNQLTELVLSARLSLELAEATLASILSRAFTSELTAEWEANNAEWIAEQQALCERLPRLALLAFIRERVNRAQEAVQPAVPMTALMKYAFLLQMEGRNHWRFYHFVPYHYGPLSKELYSDLDHLQAEGLVEVEKDTDEEKTHITITNPTRADALLAELPDSLKEEISAILDAYGDLDNNALLAAVYDKYPAYAKKSRIARTRRTRM